MPKEIYIDENGNERILSSSPSALSGLLDTDITTPSANQVLAYDGSKWGNTYPYNYSTTEKAVGTWTDGKTIYKKTIDCGNLPNNTSKNVNHNISNIDRIITFEAMATGTNSFLPVPFIGANNYVAINFSNVDIYLATNTDRSGYYLYITMYYTKSA